MSYTEICNSPWLYIFVGVILILVLAQSIIMMAKAWKHAREIGIDDKMIKKGLVNGVIVSIMPTIPVIIVLLSLIPLLGAPLPWLRLSVIGSATFESMAASLGVESVGEVLQVGGYTIAGWVAACWCMGLGGSLPVLESIIFIKPISLLYGQAEKINVKLVLTIGTGCMCGVLAYSAVNFGLSAMSTKGIVFLSSFALGVILTLGNKKWRLSWMNDFLMAICMLFGMVIACLVL